MARESRIARGNVALRLAPAMQPRVGTRVAHRADIVRLVWWIAAAFGGGSTLILALVPVKVHAAVRYSLAYGSGAALVILAVRVFDKLY